MTDFETIAEGLGSLVVAYLPALRRLTEAGLREVKSLLTARRRREALDLLRAAMTGEELAGEKAALLMMATEMADEHHQVGQALIQVAAAMLKVLVGLVVLL